MSSQIRIWDSVSKEVIPNGKRISTEELSGKMQEIIPQNLFCKQSWLKRPGLYKIRVHAILNTNKNTIKIKFQETVKAQSAIEERNERSWVKRADRTSQSYAVGRAGKSRIQKGHPAATKMQQKHWAEQVWGGGIASPAGVKGRRGPSAETCGLQLSTGPSPYWLCDLGYVTGLSGSIPQQAVPTPRIRVKWKKL